jgi:hypothetical protein
MPVQPLETPPALPWPTFETQFLAHWKQGDHVLFSGPTGSGKTVAARTLVRHRDYVVVLGTKMRDKEMDEYIAEGYKRIYEWPPTYKQRRPDENGQVHLVLWPKITTREQLRSHRNQYAKCLDDCLVDGGWSIVSDETLWLSDRKGLDLGDQLGSIAYTGRSSKVTLLALLQRPSGIPRNIWSNCSSAFVWKSGVTTDLRELATLGTYQSKETEQAIRSLKPYEFMYLPTRANAEWSVSKVDL